MGGRGASSRSSSGSSQSAAVGRAEKAEAQQTITESQGNNEQRTVEKLTAAGGSEWESGDNHRVYFNDLPELYGLQAERYGTGNISSAKLDGQKISNSKARKIESGLFGGESLVQREDGKVREQRVVGISSKEDYLQHSAQNRSRVIPGNRGTTKHTTPSVV
jgi:hypothetical protein